MTALERRACLAIEFPRVNYLPGSFDKRFSRGMGAEARLPHGGALTGKQRQLLWTKVWMYRRQIRDAELVRIARDILDGKRALPAEAPPLNPEP
jgi:hypothetical protein